MPRHKYFKKPNVFDYEQYRGFIQDLIQFRKKTQPGFKLGTLAKSADIADSYISAALKGKRGFSNAAWGRLVEALKLTPAEKNYLTTLRSINEGDSLDEHIDTLKQLHRCKTFRDKNPSQSEVYQYLTEWINVAIREMAALPDFKTDPSWIQDNLIKKVPIKEIRNSIRFLLDHGFIEAHEDGTASFKRDKGIVGDGEFFRSALKKFHKELMQLGRESIEQIKPEHRNITGETLPIHAKQLPKIRKILEGARQEIAKLSQDPEAKNPNAVYHVYFLAFPLNRLEKN